MLQVELPHAGAGVGQGRPTPLSAIDIEHEDFEWLRAYLQRNSSETTPLSDASTQGECVGRKHKSHHSSSHSTTSENYSTCDSPTEEHRTINSDSEGSRETEGPAKRRKVGWTSTEDLVILTSVRKLGTQWPRIASQLPGRTADAVNPALPRARPPCMPSHPCTPPRLSASRPALIAKRAPRLSRRRPRRPPTPLSIAACLRQVRNRWHRLQKTHALGNGEEGGAALDALLLASGMPWLTESSPWPWPYP